MYQTAQAKVRSPLDWAGITGTMLALAFFAATALYGTMSGFTPTLAYEATNLWVGLGCAGLAGLCGIYLMVEIIRPANLRVGLLLPVVCAFAGYYATIAGIPTIAAQWGGQRGAVLFSVTDASMPWGSKSCNFAIRAVNPDYAELRLCADELQPRPAVGDQLRVEGNISDWGITTDSVSVLR